MADEYSNEEFLADKLGRNLKAIGEQFRIEGKGIPPNNIDVTPEKLARLADPEGEIEDNSLSGRQVRHKADELPNLIGSVPPSNVK